MYQDIEKITANEEISISEWISDAIQQKLGHLTNIINGKKERDNEL